MPFLYVKNLYSYGYQIYYTIILSLGKRYNVKIYFLKYLVLFPPKNLRKPSQKSTFFKQ